MSAGNKKRSHFLTLEETKTTSTMLLKDCSLNIYESPSQAQEGLVEPGSDMCHSGQTVKPVLCFSALQGPTQLSIRQERESRQLQLLALLSPVLTVLSRSCQPWSL